MNFHYIRFSTAEQTADMQIEALKSYPMDKRFVDEAQSGKNMDREQFKNMVDQLRKGDTIYCYSLSRIGRNTVELIQLSNRLDELGVSLVSHVESLNTASPIGRFFFTLMAALAQFERENIEERRIQGIKAAREKGTKFGRRASLSDEQIAYIKICGLPNAVLSEKYGVSLSTVKRAKKK